MARMLSQHGRFSRGLLRAGVVACCVLATGSAVAEAAPAQTDSAAAIGSLPPVDRTEVLSPLMVAEQVLVSLGIKPFLWPTAAAFCSQIPGAPIVPALAGAIPGPYTPILGNITVFGNDLNTVKKGQVLYGFVPAGIPLDGDSTTGMDIGWFNVNTLRGGFVPMGSLVDTVLAPIEQQANDLGVAALAAPALALLRVGLDQLPQGGLRAAVVETGSGMVLSMILGSVNHPGGTCHFLPTVGVQFVG